jgi:hypothetical protein
MIYYTSSQRTDGFGAIFQNIIFDILWAEYNGYNYSFTPNKSFAHNYQKNQDFSSNLNKFMNLQDNFPTVQGSSIIPSTSTYNFIQDNIDSMFSSKTAEKIRSSFFSDKISSNDLTHLNVAVHIRRSNNEDTRLEGACTPDSYYLKIMNKVRNNYNNRKIIFHIYSQGSSENFVSFESEDTKIHLNESIEQTFLALAQADVLITSASSFSYSAALLSRGIIYYKKFWHPPLSSWIVEDS